MHRLLPDWVLLEDGFAAGRRIVVEQGAIVAVEDARSGEGGDRIAGALLPGITDLHSHMFQRSLAGLAEHAREPDDFWSWRRAMYAQAARIGAEEMRAIAAFVAMALLEGGYTGLVEFHYLFPLSGDSRQALAEAVVEGAAAAGMPLTLLFGIYETGGFGGLKLADAQLRFQNSADQALRMLADAQPSVSADLRYGLAPHSLRAVPAASLARAVEGAARIDPHAPIHIHVAEQEAENLACIADRAAPPVTWLLDHAPVGRNWCLVHATHTTREEKKRVAASGAVTGLCPTTEANLGDGIFDLPALREAGGAFGIGSDNQVSLDVFSELRCLEYGQRLARRTRNVGANQAGHTGRALWQAACSGGAEAGGRATGAIAAGFRADFVVIEPTFETATLRGAEAPDFWLDAAIFAATQAPARHVMAGGEWRVRDGAHLGRDAILRDYRAALRRLS